MTNIREDGIVEFRFFRPNARCVDITGDFNDWSDIGLTMCPDGHGWWTATARLDAGEYRFGYRADGTWLPDCASDEVEYTKAGCRSMLVIRTPRSGTAAKMTATATATTDHKEQRTTTQNKNAKSAAA